MEAAVTEDILYLATLQRLKGIGGQSLLRIIASFPTRQELLQASESEREEKLGRPLACTLSQSLLSWKEAQETAQEALLKYGERGVVAIPITAEHYPPLLKLIANPPALLYAKGNIALLKQLQAVAIVGTREPTEPGRKLASFLARRWVHYGYTVVSGLAKGIDTAAHQGALDAKGKTIAVLGTPLDKIYPAENKGLAERIVNEGGLLLSELTFGQAGFKTAFVQRDRIQSGLCLGVIPVQTKKDGGTMHTVHFAIEQKRYVACPHPVAEEQRASQYEGIWFLIHTKEALPFRAEREQNYEILCRYFQERLHRLLAAQSVKQQAAAPPQEALTEPRSLWDAVQQNSEIR